MMKIGMIAIISGRRRAGNPGISNCETCGNRKGGAQNPGKYGIWIPGLALRAIPE
jgi:hypothetical protein